MQETTVQFRVKGRTQEIKMKSLVMVAEGEGYDGELREPLVRRQGSQVSMSVARGSASLFSSPGRGLGHQGV